MTIGLVLTIAAFTTVGESSTAACRSSGAGNVMVEIVADGFRVRLDLSEQVVGLSLPDDVVSHATAHVRDREPTIHPTLSGLLQDRFVSASLLAQKGKQFDDGLYAAVELAAQNGAGKFAGKLPLLEMLMAALADYRRDAVVGQRIPAEETAVPLVFAAAKLGGSQFGIPASQRTAAEAVLKEFFADAPRSRPVGFYSWCEALGRVYRQDRLLQTELQGRQSIAAIAQCVRNNPAAKTAYTAYLAMVTGLTNPPPPSRMSVMDVIEREGGSISGRGVCLFPPSRSHESDLASRLLENRRMPDGLTLGDALLSCIRSTELRLTPTRQSGWYDYQTWALEPLAVLERMPEGKRLRCDDDYRRQLDELFKGVLALTRETHVKQLDSLRTIAAIPEREPVVRINPQLTIEPLPTYYLRRALGYSQVRATLASTFGESALGSLHRLTPDGPVDEDVDRELAFMESLWFGAYLIACRELGMTADEYPGDSPRRNADGDERAARLWIARLDADSDIARDSRMMVPVSCGEVGGKTRVWMMLGWACRPL